MENKKGFTLIELLGVIVIIGVISLVVSPIIIGTVEKAKKASFERSIEGVIKTVKLDMANDDFTVPREYFLHENNLSLLTAGGVVKNEQIKINGKIEGSGYITIDEEGNVTISQFCNKEYCVNGKENDIEITENETGEIPNIDLADPSITLNGEEYLKVKQNTEYIELGAKANTKAGQALEYQIEIKLNGNVVNSLDTSVIGTIYEITYTTTSNNKIVSVTRTVEIVDGTGPVITVDPEEVTLTLSEVSGYDIYNGITITDNIDGIIEVNSSNVKVEGSLSAIVGTYEITYIVTDSSGNTSKKTRTIKVIDTEGPILNFSSVNTDGYVKEITITATAVDDTEITTFTYEIIKDNESYQTETINVNNKNVEETITLNETGIYTIKLTATDNQNNTSELESGEYKIDGDGPNISFTDNVEIETEEVLNYNIYDGVTVIDNVDGTIEVNSTNVKVEGSLTKTLGEQTLTYTVSDKLGNTSSKTRTFDIVDETKPTITISPNKQEDYKQEVIVTITATDNMKLNSLSYVLINNGTRGTSTSINSGDTITLNTTGNYQIEVIAIDSSNNTNVVTSGIYNIDTTGPTLTVDPKEVTLTTQQAQNYIPLTGVKAEDNVDGTEVRIETEGSLSGSEGTYEITYTAYDKLGNPSESIKRTFIVVEGEGPLVDATVTTGWVSSANVTISAVDKSNLKSFTYVVEKGGTQYQTGNGTITGNSGTGTITLNETGEYYITVSATDEYGTPNSVKKGLYQIDAEEPELTVSGYEMIQGTSYLVTKLYTATFGPSEGSTVCKVGSTTVRDLSELGVGTHTLSCTATSNAGKAKTASSSITIKSPNVDTTGATKPSLANNLIPIKWNTSTSKWIRADESNPSGANQWYDYNSQMWANAASVTTAYRNAAVGAEIPESAILAYFVWIPRYEYQYTNLGTSYAGGSQAQPGEIKINFVEASDTTASTNYKIHPAFTFGSTQLAGFWVGKFETSTETSSTCYTSANTTNCDNTSQSPRINPGVYSLRYQKVSNQFATAQKFSASGNSYGIATTADAHMMKNSEWGAVAYLSQSKYGKYGNSSYSGANKEVYMNNYWNDPNTLTGCSAGAPSTSKSTSCAYTYEKEYYGTGASTTGTIYGVYDMSGGSWEYVMGNYNNYSGYNASSNSGFTGTLGQGGSHTGTAFPNSKYYDKYTTTDATTACSGGICYGHALSETSGWYSDYAHFVSADSPWLLRGGHYSGTTGAGVFSFSRSYGNASDYSFRVVVLG